MALTDEDRIGMFALIAQGVLNIDCGINFIEPGSRIHRAMTQFCEELSHFQDGKEPCPCCGRRPTKKKAR